MQDNNEKSVWKSRWQAKMKLNHSTCDYVMLTRTEYKDEDGFDNGLENPYWVGQFHSVKLTPEDFKQYRASNDPDHTLNQRVNVGDKRVGDPKNKYFFSAIHFDVFHLDEVKDAKGRVKTYDKGEKAGEVIQSWQQVASIKRRERLCKSPDENTQFYRKKYLEVGPAHYEDLMTIIDKANKLCHCDGTLKISNYSCENCGEDMLDLDSEDLTPADIIRFGKGDKMCPHCRHKGEPVPSYDCNKCENPTPHAFDQVVVKMKKSGSGPQTKLDIEDVISVKHFLTDNKEHIVEMDEDGNPIIEDGLFMFKEGIEELIDAKWDFDAGHPIPSSGEVSAYLNLQPGQEGYSQNSTSYASKKKTIDRRRFR